MADIAERYNFGSSPQIYHTVSYETKREGTSIKVRFKTVTSAVQSPSYFGYDLRLDITLNGSKVCDDQYIKNNSPSTWSAITKYWPSSTGWYTVSNITTQSTLDVSFYFRTNSSRPNMTAKGTVRVPNYVYPKSPTSVSTTESVVAQSNTSFTIKWSGASSGSTSISKYRIYYSLGSGWVNYKDVSNSSTSGSSSCTLSGITSTRGTKVRFAVATIDSKGYISSDRPETNVTLAKLPTAPTTVNVSAGTVAQVTTNVTLSWGGATAGSGSVSKYRIYYRTSTTASWTTLKDVTGTSTTVNLNGIVTTRGSSVYFTVGTINSYSLVSSTGGPSKTVTLAKIPSIPTALTISNYNPKRTDSITLSWSGATAGSGTINNYSVDVRRYKNGSWSDWQNINNPTSTSYTWAIISTYSDLSPNDIIQVRIGVRNSYSLTAGTWKYGNDITIKGGVIRVKVNGSWREGIVYIKVNGTWKEASSVYVNNNGVWKESL